MICDIKNFYVSSYVSHGKSCVWVLCTGWSFCRNKFVVLKNSRGFFYKAFSNSEIVNILNETKQNMPFVCERTIKSIEYSRRCNNE